MFKRKVQVWGIHRESKNILILKLIPERGSWWQPVTGGVEEGESYLVAAQREFFEETGILPEDGSWRDQGMQYYFKGRFGFASESVFTIDLFGIPKSIKLDPTEHLEWKWVNYENMEENFFHFPIQNDAFKKILGKGK